MICRSTAACFLLSFTSLLPSLKAENALADFGSGEPVLRQDMPERGTIKLLPKDGIFRPLDHWEQYDWTLKAKRWGHYKVMLRYAMRQSTLTVQFKHEETRLKKRLTVSPSSRTTLIGEIFVPKAGDQLVSIYTTQSAQAGGFAVDELILIPTNEGEPHLKAAEDGSITLQAQDATTWSENMRYEPKPEKNCLGFWTSEEDFAEWDFETTKPGKYNVVVTQGCGTGNGGSEVAVKLAGQELRFTVKDTGGFQKWEDVMTGQVEIMEAGAQRLVIDPINKANSAIMDVQKVQLVPVK
jgi:hypothetical protein